MENGAQKDYVVQDRFKHVLPGERVIIISGRHGIISLVFYSFEGRVLFFFKNPFDF